MTETGTGPPTLYEWAGGGKAFERLINAFYDRVEAVDLLTPFFPGGVSEEHRRHVVAWWSEVFGGPRATPRSSAATTGWSSTTAACRSLPSSPS
jgi:truncated hemoglobin YjbI